MLTKTLNIKYILKDFLSYCQPFFPELKPQHSEIPKICSFILATTLQF